MNALIGEERVRELLHYAELIPAMERALLDFSAGRVTQPVRTILPVPEHGGFWGLMPCIYGNWLGIKIVTFYPGNARDRRHTHNAVVQLFRADTGEPVAAVDARLVTEMRTAAVSAVATRVLAPRDAKVLAILGSGVQARSHAWALRMVREFREVRLWSPNAERARGCAGEISARLMASAEDAVRGADVVVTATAAETPILRGAWLGERTFVNAIGGIPAPRRELDDEAMRGAIVVESREAAMKESGDVVGSGAQIYAELGEVLAGVKPAPQGRVVFKSVGIAVEDVAAAGLVVERTLS